MNAEFSALFVRRSRSSRPPWPRISSAAIARPSPVPPARPALKGREQMLARLCRQAGAGVANPDPPFASVSPPEISMVPSCPWPRSPDGRCAPDWTARGTTVGIRAERHAARNLDQAGHRAAGRKPLALGHFLGQRRSAKRVRRGGGSSALPKASVHSHRLTAREIELISLGAAPRPPDRRCPPSGRRTVAPWSGCCADRG